MLNKWIINPLNDDQKRLEKEIAQQINIDTVLARLLVQRGVTTFDEAKAFFRPSLDMLHNPFTMAGMQEAVSRLNEAIAQNEKIMVYGDYDVDGTTAVALVYKFLRKYSSQLLFYIPDRYKEGYGISYQGIDFAKEQGVTLVIALDCGIKAVEKVDYANEKGIDFIICDHHNPGDKLPNAIAVLDPKREDCQYPYKHLSGCGVGFKLMQAFADSNQMDFKELLPLLDLLALSISSDIVPVTGENRVLLHFGLKRLNENPSIGVKSIVDVCGLAGKEITVSDIVFKIGPRINAAGRISSGREAVELLIETDYKMAMKRSAEVDSHNENRRDLDKTMTQEAVEQIHNDESFKDKKSIVIYEPTWHKGVVGIVASRLAEEYYKPTVVLTLSNGIATGSARSIPGFDLYSAIDSCHDLLETFGGHLYAAGLSMKEENVPEFMKRFEEFVASNIQPEQVQPQIEIDSEVDFATITTPRFFNILRQFAPFGPENMKPMFVTRSVRDAGSSKVVGKGGEHIKMDIRDHSSDAIVNGIAFNFSKFAEDLRMGEPLDIVYTIEENTFNGKTSMQLMVRDIHYPEK